MNIAIIVSEFNNKITSRMHQVALEKAKELKNSTANRISELSIKYQKPVSLGISGPGMAERQAYARIRPVAERAVEAVSRLDKELKRIS